MVVNNEYKIKVFDEDEKNKIPLDELISELVKARNLGFVNYSVWYGINDSCNIYLNK